MISSWLRPFDSRNASRFARGEDWTLGSERKVRAEETRSSRMAIEEGLLAGECCLLLLQVLDERRVGLGRSGGCHVSIGEAGSWT